MCKKEIGVEGLFICNGFQTINNAPGVRSLFKTWLQEKVSDFNEDEHYYCAINAGTPSTAISWKQVVGGQADYTEYKGTEAFKYQRYYIGKYKGDGEWEKIGWVTGKVITEQFKEKAKEQGNKDLSRCNINETILEKLNSEDVQVVYHSQSES